MIPDLTPVEIERFYSRIRITGCGMLWTGPFNNHGYGRFEFYRPGKRVRVMAHRLSYFLATGEDPGTGKIRHACDTPPCCTPDCLEPGTQTDNMRDAVSRGRLDTSGLSAFREARLADAIARISADEKKCPGCGRTKPMDDFGRDASTIDGHNHRCKACLSDRRYRQARREAERAA